MRKFLNTEFRAAFAKHAQPVAFRVGKYLALGAFVWLFRGTAWFWWGLAGLAIGGLLLHGFYRYKTRGWTRSYGRGILRWDHEKVMREKRAR